MLALTEIWCNKCARTVENIWYRFEITAEAANGRSLGWEMLLCERCAQRKIGA